MAAESSLLTESVQMYLVNILRLGEEGQPVPLSRLAAALHVSPISVNQMCRRLQDEGVVTYVPYKGASLTSEGQQLAARILRRHRLWEVFLVEHLQMTWEQAHDAACRLEHTTPDDVVERLDVFLGHPRVNPEGEPIPPSSGGFSPAPLRPLAEMKVGQSGYFSQCTADETACAFLADQGLRPGAPLQVLAVAPRGSLVEVDGRRVALSHSLAIALHVKPDEKRADDELRSSGELPEHEEKGTELIQMPLDRLAIGQRGVIVKVGGERRLRHRLLEMGVVPGETIAVKRMAPLGDPVELIVKGYHLSLRRSEASQILVELER